MSAIDEFDSVVSDRIVDAIEGFVDNVKDFGNLEDKNREKPRELPCRHADFKDDSEEPANTEENMELWRQGKEFEEKEHTQITVQAQVHRTTNPVHHAQANPTERVNRVLKTMIVAFLRDDHKEWDLHLH